MKRRRVLVTGAGATGVGASVIQALQGDRGAARRWSPVAADAHPFSWGLHAARGGGMVAPWAHEDGYLEWVAGAVKKARVVAVIPGTEAETALLAGHRGEIGVPVIANDARLMPLMRDKARAQQALRELALPSIPTFTWDGRMGAAEHGFPLVAKPAHDSSGSRGLRLITTRSELGRLPRGDVIVQPYLGDTSSEYTAGVVSGGDGTAVGSIVMRRELTGLSLLAERGGAAISTGFSQGHIVRDDRVQRFCENLAHRLGSTGPLNVQLRVHKGECFAFEIHPRFSFSTSIRAAAGFNEPDMLLRHMVDGERLACPRYRAGVTAIRYFGHVLVPSGEVRA